MKAFIFTSGARVRVASLFEGELDPRMERLLKALAAELGYQVQIVELTPMIGLANLLISEKENSDAHHGRESEILTPAPERPAR